MRKVIDRIIQFLITVIMAFMVAAVCWQVFTRFVLKNPSTLTEEALRFLLIWVTMVGGAYAYGRKKHLSINLIDRVIPVKTRPLYDIFVQLIVILFCIFVMIRGGLSLLGTAEGMVSAAIGIPMQYVYVSVIAGGILFIFYTIAFILEDIQEVRKKTGEVTGK